MGLTMNTPTFNVSLSPSTTSNLKDDDLTLNNLEQYLTSICSVFLMQNSNQIVQRGLASLLQRDYHFLPFTEWEMAAMVTGSSGQDFDEWNPKYLGKFVVLEQFEKGSPVIANLFDVLCRFSRKQKRQFIRFLTGSLSLPLGGLCKLTPPFSITKFGAELNGDGDFDSLPHATTCRHTLRLPPYRTKKTLKKKLVQAMTQCQMGFYL